MKDKLKGFQYEVHPDDLKIKNEPTFFEQLTQGVKAEEDNSDEELEEEEVPKKKSETTAAAPQANQKEQEIPKGKTKTEQFDSSIVLI